MHVVSGKDCPGTGRSRAAVKSMTVSGVLCLMALIAALAAAREAAAAQTLARWPLDEGAGQLAADVSGHEHHARLGKSHHSDPHDPAWVNGRFGRALRFVGESDQYAEIGRPATLTPPTVTVEAWVRRLNTPGRWRYVISNGGQQCEFASFGLYSGGDGGLAFYASDRNGYVVSPSAARTDVWDGAWHYAVGTYDGQHVRLYLDGAEVGQGSAAQFAIFYGLGSQAGFIGTYRGSCEKPFTGDVDEIAVRDGALSAAEIAALAQGAAGRPEPPQAPPVTGPPAEEPGAPATDPPPAEADCFTVRVRPGRLVVHRRTRLRIAVRRRGAAASGVRVTVRGPGVRASARTGRTGRASLVVRSRRRGRLRVAVRGRPGACAASHVKVLRQPGG
jgi:hypothetical protein